MKRKQQGAVLIVGLIILLMLGMIGTGSLKNITSQQKMISNVHDDNRAFQGAEAALAWCEKLLDDLTLVYDENIMATQIHASDSENEAAELTQNWWDDQFFWQSYGIPLADVEFSGENHPASLALQPRCYRQRVKQQGGAVGQAFYQRFSDAEDVMADQRGDAQRASGIYHFRVTAEAGGAGRHSDGSRNTQVVLQIDYFKRLF